MVSTIFRFIGLGKILPDNCKCRHFKYFKVVCGGALVMLWAMYSNKEWLCSTNSVRLINSWNSFFLRSEPGNYYKYLIVGTGQAAREAVRVIRTSDPSGSVLILSDQTSEESSRPSFHSLLNDYLMRKEDWNQDCSEKEDNPSVGFNWSGVQTNQLKDNLSHGLEPTIADRVQKLDIRHNRILLSNGEWIRYGKLLLSPADYLDVPWDVLVAKDCANYVYWRIWELDKEELNRLANGWTKSHSLPHITVVGGGWDAVGYVCKLKQLGFPITMVFPEPFILAKYLPKYLCDYISNKLKAKGVDLVSYAFIRYVSKASSTLSIGHLDVHISRTYDSTNTGYFHTDYVFFVPTDMSSGCLRWSKDIEDILELDVSNGGILCNAELLAASDVYVAGSAVSFPNRLIGRRREQGSEEHNCWSGRVVGVNMTGGREYYQRMPMKEMEFGDICMPMFLFGDIDSSYDCVSYFHMDHRNRQQKVKDWDVIPTGGLSRYFDGVERAVVFFLKSNVIVGICLWNVKDSSAYEIARTIVGEIVSSNLRQLASQLCDTRADQLIEKSNVGRTTHPYYPHPRGWNSNSSSGDATKASSYKHTSLDFKKSEILWETRDHFVSGRTQSDLKKEAFRKAIFGNKF